MVDGGAKIAYYDNGPESRVCLQCIMIDFGFCVSSFRKTTLVIEQIKSTNNAATGKAMDR